MLMLYKSAETSDDDRKTRNIGLAGLAATGIGLGINNISQRKFLDAAANYKDHTYDLSSYEVERLKKLLGAHKRNIKYEPLFTSDAAASNFNPVNNTVQAPTRSPLLAHEYGHATSPLLVGRGKVVGTLGGALSHGIGIKWAPFIRGYTAYKNEVEGEKTKGRQVADALSIGGAGLGLAEEGQASFRGYQALKKLRGKEYANAVAKKIFLPGFASYLGATAIGHLGAPAIGKYLGKLRRRQLEEAERASRE